MNTAKKGEKILLQKPGYFELSATERRNIVDAFAKKGKTVKKSAFDLIHTNSKVNFSDKKDITKKLSSITLIEIKSTKNNLDKKFSGHFFGITENQEKLGKILPNQCKFVFVNTKYKYILALNYSQLLKRIKRKHMVAHVTI